MGLLIVGADKRRHWLWHPTRFLLHGCQAALDVVTHWVCDVCGSGYVCTSRQSEVSLDADSQWLDRCFALV